MKIFTTLVFTIILPVTILISQEKKAGFSPPLDTKLLLSGTFGELRTDHFHSGIDIKTNGQEGANIYAIADGYISRIKVSGGGFGKALYITHPNGYTSVYAHLKQFSDTIENYVRDQQYKHEISEINLFPAKEIFPVKQGEMIALSGNTGSSLGPHLHFEIRETRTEKPVNPMLFGFKVKDFIRPRILALKVYPENTHSTVDHQNEPKEFKVNGWGIKHRIKNHDTIEVSGDISFGILSFDLLNGAHNKNGAYSFALFIDSVLVYAHKMDAFSFGESRYINSMIDYAEYADSKRRFQRTAIDPNNQLKVYGKVLNNGIHSFTDTALYHLKYEIKDISGNVSELNFVVLSSPLDSFVVPPKKNNGILFTWQGDNEFSTDSIKLFTRPASFYDSFTFTYQTEKKQTDTLFSDIHCVHKESTPVHKYMSLSIKPDSIPPGKVDKLLVVKLENNGQIISSGGKPDAGFITASVRSFGNYAIAIDTIPPDIQEKKRKKKNKVEKGDVIAFKVKDDLSGISSYQGSLNGEWILIEFDPKNDLMTYTVDHMIKKGNNNFVLTVTDDRGNKSIFEATLSF